MYASCWCCALYHARAPSQHSLEVCFPSAHACLPLSLLAFYPITEGRTAAAYRNRWSRHAQWVCPNETGVPCRFDETNSSALWLSSPPAHSVRQVGGVELAQEAVSLHAARGTLTRSGVCERERETEGERERVSENTSYGAVGSIIAPLRLYRAPTAAYAPSLGTVHAAGKCSSASRNAGRRGCGSFLVETFLH